MKKIAFIALLVLTLVALFTVGTYAWFTGGNEATNTLIAGTVKIEIIETGADGLPAAGGIFADNWTGTVTTKEVSVKSLGSKKTYARVSLTPVWYSVDGDPKPGLPVDNVQLNLASGYSVNWTYSDGWYYYKRILNQDEVTELLLTSVTLSSTDGYEGLVLKIVINAEGVQASHDAYKDAWQLTSLPAGVEPWVAP